MINRINIFLNTQISISTLNKTKVTDRQMCARISPGTATVFGMFHRSHQIRV